MAGFGVAVGEGELFGADTFVVVVEEAPLEELLEEPGLEMLDPTQRVTEEVSMLEPYSKPVEEVPELLQPKAAGTVMLCEIRNAVISSERFFPTDMPKP
jgi:hypothetical protein